MIETLKELAKKLWRDFALLFAAALILGGALGIWAEMSLEKPSKIVAEVYIVQPGDTFMKICEEYRERDIRDPYIFEFMDEIKKLNPWLEVESGQIFPGQLIKIQYRE